MFIDFFTLLKVTSLWQSTSCVCSTFSRIVQYCWIPQGSNSIFFSLEYFFYLNSSMSLSSSGWFNSIYWWKPHVAPRNTWSLNTYKVELLWFCFSNLCIQAWKYPVITFLKKCARCSSEWKKAVNQLLFTSTLFCDFLELNWIATNFRDQAFSRPLW